jgi:hypothetical protein
MSFQVVRKRTYRRHVAPEECFNAAEWRGYLSKHQVQTPLPHEVKINTRWLIMKTRAAMLAGEKMTTEEKEEELRFAEGFVELAFSDSKANKARLRVGKYTVSHCLRMLRAEMSYFAKTGKILLRTKHLTPDVPPRNMPKI